MEDVDVKEKGFTKFQHNDLDAIICSELTQSQLKTVLVVYRYSVGCHKEWAKIKKCQLEVAGIESSHVNRVLEPLINRNILDYDGDSGYRLNKEWVGIQIEIDDEKSSRAQELLKANLPKRGYQFGKAKVASVVSEELPEWEVLDYQFGNNEEQKEPRVGSCLPTKDIFKENKYKSDIKQNITNKKRTIKEIIENPNSEVEAKAVELLRKVEPNNYGSFPFYLRAVREVGFDTLYPFASEVVHDKYIKVEDRGKVFNSKVQCYLESNGLR